MMLLPLSLRAADAKSFLQRERFGSLPDGRQIERFTLRNSKGMEAQIMTYGGIIISLRAPDRQGHFDDVVLGYDTLAG